MKKVFNVIDCIYIYITSLIAGGIICIGVFVAPSVFYSLDSNITNFQSGIIMSNIFIKWSFVLNFLAIIILLYEILNIFFKRYSSLFISLIMFVCIILFNFYYLPHILQIQTLGELATQSAEFNMYHKQSELVFKILFISLSVNSLYKIFKIQNCK